MDRAPFPSCKMVGEKAEKPILRRRNLKPRRLMLAAKSRRVTSRPRPLRRGSPTAAETLF